MMITLPARLANSRPYAISDRSLASVQSSSSQSAEGQFFNLFDEKETYASTKPTCSLPTTATQ